jgi:bifunctional UDP-N-acetylglucosamine pyrophosphorylase/glucosamine-1-phosphate N-acetyltransferase
MGSYVLDTLAAVGVRQAVVVTGVEGARISKRLLEDPPGFPVRFVEQKIDRGDGEAVLLGLSGFDDFNDDEDLLIVPSDVPLLRPPMVRQLLDGHRSSGAACTLLAVEADVADASFGRIVRDRHGRVAAIRSTRSTRRRPLDDEGVTDQAAAGVMCVRRGLLAPAIRRTVAEIPAGELQLSDVVAVLVESGHTCETVMVEAAPDLTPVGNRLQLAEAEAELRHRTNRYWLSMGVTMVDPDRTYIDVTVQLGTDITLFPGTMLQGSTTIGDGCELGPDVRLDRCRVGKNTSIEQVTARLATIGDDCVVGPFAVLQPGADVPNGTTTGPFYAGGRTP